MDESLPARNGDEPEGNCRPNATAGDGSLGFSALQNWRSFEPSFVLKADLKPEARREPQFFFSADSIPELCARLRERFPKETDQIIKRAERICQHRFDLLGYKDLDYGTEIDWHLDRVHGKQAPRKPWFKIHYLDFAEVGDSKASHGN